MINSVLESVGNENIAALFLQGKFSILLLGFVAAKYCLSEGNPDWRES